MELSYISSTSFKLLTKLKQIFPKTQQDKSNIQKKCSEHE